jgi:hypothetical protein
MVYKQTASEGNFSSFQVKTPNEVPKIIEETNRRVRGLKEVNAFEAKNREIFLRAQQYAQEVEQKNREENFKLETDNRQQFIDAEKANMEALIKDNEKAGLRQEKNFKALQEFSGNALEAYTAIQDARRQNRLFAAGELAQVTGITQDRVSAITRLDSGLSRAEFESLDFIQEIYNDNTPDEVKQAYFKIYQNKGTREYVRNKWITQNTANAALGAWQREELRLREENPNITAEELQAKYQEWKSTYIIAASKIGDKNISADFLTKNFYTLFNPIARGIEAKIQRGRVEEQEGDLLQARYQAIGTVFQDERIAGLMRLLKEAPNAQRRKEIVQFLINSAASQAEGSATITDLEGFLGYPVQGMPGNPAFGKQFPVEAALLETARRQIKNQERAESEALRRDQIVAAEFKIQSKAAELFGDGIATKAEIEILEALKNREAPLDYDSPALAEFKKQSRWEKAKDQLEADFTTMRAMGTLTTDVVLEAGLPQELETKWLAQARVAEKFKNKPETVANDKQIKQRLQQHPEIKTSLDGRVNDSVLNMAAFYTRKRNEKFAQLVADGMEVTQAGEVATAEILKTIDEVISKPGAVENGRYVGADNLNKARVKEADALIKRNEAVEEYSKKRSTMTAADIVKRLDKDKYEIYVGQMQTTGQIPAEVRVHAEKMKMTPYEWVNHIADELGVEQLKVPPELKPWAEYLEEVEPATRNLFTVNPTDARLNRGRAIAENRVTRLPVRSHFAPTLSPGERSFTGALTYEGNRQSYIDAGNAFVDAGFRVGEQSDFDPIDGTHSSVSYHHHNEAFDITHQTGDYNESIEKTRQLKELVRQLGLFKEVIGPGDYDEGKWHDRSHDTHLHVGGLMRPITPEDIEMIKMITEN